MAGLLCGALTLAAGWESARSAGSASLHQPAPTLQACGGANAVPCGSLGLTPSLCGATGLTPSRVGHWGSRRPVWWGCGRGSWPHSVASLPRGPSPRPGGSPRAVRPGPPPPGRLPPALRAFVFLAPAPSWAPLPAPALGGSFLRRRRFASVVLGAGACRPFSPAPRLPPFPLLFFVGLLCFV